MKDSTTITYGQHEALVRDLFVDTTEIAKTITPEQLRLLHAAIGIAGEAGEILDVVKKVVFYQQPLDEAKLAHLIEETGDCMFYLTALGQALGFRPVDAMSANLSKLSKRYPQGKFTTEHAAARLDKA